MFCYQCEQTAKGTGCNVFGVCGKDPKTAALQDLLVYAAKGISMYAHRAAELNARDPAVDRAVLEFLFATVTNVDFDPERLQRHLLDAAKIRDKAKTLYENGLRQSRQDPRDARRARRLAAGRRSRRAGPPGRRPLAHQAAGAVGQRRDRTAGVDPLRPEGRRGLCRSRQDSRPGRPEDLRHVPRRARLPHPRKPHDRRTARLGVAGRRVEPVGDATAGRRQHRRLRPSRADRRSRHADPRQVHLRLRPRPERPRRTAAANRRPRDQRLHARRNAPLPRLSETEEVQAPGGQLRRGVAGPGQGIRRVPRRRPDDDQLHPEAAERPTRAASSPAGWWRGRACGTSAPTAISRR